MPGEPGEVNIYNDAAQPEKEVFGTRKTNLSRVAGVTPEEEAKAIEDTKNPKEKSERHYAELEKTPEEFKLTEDILRKMPEFLDKYDIKAMALSADNVHFLDVERLMYLDKVKMAFTESANVGVCMQAAQFVGTKRINNKLQQAQVIAHEVLHLNAFWSGAKHGHEPGLMRMRRRGIGVSSKNEKTMYFGYLDEAIIAELTTRFDQAYFGRIPELAKDVKIRDSVVEDAADGRIPALKGKSGEIGFVDIKAPVNGRAETKVTLTGYEQPRAEFWKLIGEIAALPKNKNKSKEDIFKVFAKAALTGRLLGTKKDPGVARLIKVARPGKHPFRDFGKIMERENTVVSY